MIKRLVSTHKKTLVAMCHDVIVCSAAYCISFLLALGSLDRAIEVLEDVPVFLIVIFTQFIILYLSGLYRGIWRYSSTLDLLKLIKGASFGVVFSALFIFFYNRLSTFPRSVFFIDWLVLIVGLGGGRLAYRVIREQIGVLEIARSDDSVCAVIVGAGAAGEQLVREIRRSPHLKIKAVAIVDDDLSKRGKSLHGVTICGGVSDLVQVVKRYEATQVYIAIAAATSKQIDRIVKNSRDTGVAFKALPRISDILNGKISLSQFRDVKPEDLLGREETSLDESSINSLVNNETVMVTGAGGSIGSELCRQIARFKPKDLILFDSSEFNLYQLEHRLREEYPDLSFKVIIGDIREKKRLFNVVDGGKPQVIFHAAAYKHVPMMEMNPTESIKTNILGTRNVAEVAAELKVKNFVLVSTDKAVRPTNVMGATKRIAEMICQEVHRMASNTKFMIVRFGNVLGSSGSVIPLFTKQIKKGGPITVTHPEVTRFFMSIPEACQLVMQAGAIGKGGEVFVLDMGKSVKISHLAKQMISIYGLTEKEIEITYTGLRPGEKLYEELLLQGEDILPTVHPLLKIASVKPNNITLWDKVEDLVQLVYSSKKVTTEDLKSKLKDIVEDYAPSSEGKNGDKDKTKGNILNIVH